MIKSAKDILCLTDSLKLEADYDIYFFLSHINFYLVNDSYNYNTNENTRVSYKEPYYYNFDGRRDISLRVVYFDDVAVALTQNAGREGDDHEELFVLNRSLFIECVNYIDSLCGKVEFDRFASLNVIDENYDKEDLTTFYGYNVNVFNYTHLNELSDLESIKCNIGDTVLADVFCISNDLNLFISDKEKCEVIVESKSERNLYRYIVGYLKNKKKIFKDDIDKSNSFNSNYDVEFIEDASLLDKKDRIYVILNFQLEEIRQ